MSLSKEALRKTFWRGMPLQGCFNYERQQTVGWLYGLVPGLKEIYANDPEGLKEALVRHTGFYNTSPQFTSVIQGIVLAMEEQKANGSELISGDAIVAIRTALIGPLAGIGDSLFWGTLRTIGLGVGIELCLVGNMFGPILFLLIHNVPHVLCRYYGLKFGYEKGVDFFTSAEGAAQMQDITDATKIVGNVVVGSMIATMVGFSTKIVIHSGETAYPLQDMFDSIMPKLLPLALVFFCYYLINKKHVKTLTLLLALIIFSILLVAIESIPIFAA